MICLELARLMGGGIAVESEPGRGTCFQVEVRLVQAPDAPAGAMERVDSKAQLLLRADQAPARILVADDIDDNRRLACQILRDAGFETAEAADGAQAVAMFELDRPAGILMDLRMPVLNGEDAIRRIRALPGGDRVRIVALTASVFEENRQDVLEAGADDFLTKPIQDRILVARMAELIGVELVASPREESPVPVPAHERPQTKLSPQVVAELHAAVNAAAYDRILSIIDSLKGQDRVLAQDLERLANGFEYDQLLAAIGAPTSPER